MENKDAIILELRREIEELKKIVANLLQENAELKKENAELRKENADLKELLRLNSQNSSKPPSSDRYPKKDPPSFTKKNEQKEEDFLGNGFQKKKSHKSLTIYQSNVINVDRLILFLGQELQKLVKL